MDKPPSPFRASLNVVARDPCCGDGLPAVSRRELLRAGGLAGVAGLSMALVAGPFARRAAGQAAPPGRFVPQDKKLTQSWLRRLVEKGQSRVYRGEELRTIAMPVGGIAAGQVYLTGDGRLAHWDVFNATPNTGPGLSYRDFITPRQPLEQGFTLAATVGGQEHVRPLDQAGFPDVTFVGEYPSAASPTPTTRFRSGRRWRRSARSARSRRPTRRCRRR